MNVLNHYPYKAVVVYTIAGKKSASPILDKLIWECWYTTGCYYKTSYYIKVCDTKRFKYL